MYKYLKTRCSTQCPCFTQVNKKPSYTASGLLNVELAAETDWQLYPITECNIQCSCNEDSCSNRLVQHGCKFNLEKFATLNKGQGLRTLEFIPAGSFVIAYLGL